MDNIQKWQQSGRAYIQGKPGQEKNVCSLSKLLHMIKQYTSDILESMHIKVVAGGFQNKSHFLDHVLKKF